MGKVKIKVLNLYAGIGGNRKNWPDDKIEVTAVENDLEVAIIYADFFKNDLIIIGDAHQYLLDHYKEFDFIWCSPPCKTHSRINHCYSGKRNKPRFPDLKLYEEIIFLQKYFKGSFVVENVIPYYKPLIKPTALIQRHFFWSNLPLESAPEVNMAKEPMTKVTNGSTRFGINLHNYKVSAKKGKRQMLRNLVDPELGKIIFDKFLDLKNKKESSPGTPSKKNQELMNNDNFKI